VPSPVPAGQRDLFNESFFEYGSRVGVWRLLDLFDKYQVPTTFYCCAVALEHNPQVAREIVPGVTKSVATATSGKSTT
jgi:peptidoglycan/xylan/chitin deacetylase (PgdA/CDA1 family)